jgi:hypothetical protein
VTAAKNREEELIRENSLLRAELVQLKQQAREMQILRNLTETLQACNSREEAYPFIALAASESFTALSGALAVPLLGAPGFLERAAEWGTKPWMKADFPVEDCWALRRGAMHEPGRGTVCRHSENESSDPYVCVPLAVRGEVAGLLSLRFAEAPGEKCRSALAAFGNAVALGLSTLRLRETLCQLTAPGAQN